MRDENLHKLSELADRTVSDPVTAAILLCYVMQQTARPLDTDLLYEIAVTSGMINYFAFQEALQSLQEKGTVFCEDKDGKTYCSLTENGLNTAEKLRSLAGKSYRERISALASAAVQRQKNEEQVKISYETLPQGCHLHIRLIDHDLVLLELTLFTPDEYQARLIGDKILTDPSTVYHKILGAVMPDSKN